MHADEADGETIDSRPLLHARGSRQRASVHFI
jgi:hypothetical protein